MTEEARTPETGDMIEQTRQASRAAYVLAWECRMAERHGEPPERYGSWVACAWQLYYGHPMPPDVKQGLDADFIVRLSRYLEDEEFFLEHLNNPHKARRPA